jgi:hypothetical protein
MLDLLRQCRTCREDKALAEFWGQPTRKDGLQSECRTCQKIRWHRNRMRHPDKYRSILNKGTKAMRIRNPEKAILNSIRARAKQKGIEFDLTINDIVLPKKCPILGIDLDPGLGLGHGASLAQRDRRPSVDRINNKLGYIPGNIVIVSYRANRIKSDATVAELIAIADWYEGLEDGRSKSPSQPGNTGEEREIRKSENAMSEMLSHQEEQERTMSFGEN